MTGSRGKEVMTMLIERIGEPAALELLAEECTELAHAALKLARAERGENPTPMQMEECYAAVIEEWADVIICMGELADRDWNNSDEFDRIYEEKLDRMRKRLELTGEGEE